jgi:hypothetical protein
MALHFASKIFKPQGSTKTEMSGGKSFTHFPALIRVNPRKSVVTSRREFSDQLAARAP